MKRGTVCARAGDWTETLEATLVPKSKVKGVILAKAPNCLARAMRTFPNLLTTDTYTTRNPSEMIYNSLVAWANLCPAPPAPPPPPPSEGVVTCTDLGHIVYSLM